MNTSIRPGQVYLDENGKRIEAHGGYIFIDGDTFYWYGENKEKTLGKDKMWTYGIRYYSSKDFYNWKDEGFLIEPSDDKKNVMFYERRIDRPHIIKNKKGEYICWIKYNDSSSFAIFKAEEFKGPYTLINEKYQAYGKKCGDFDFNYDEEGNIYLFVEVDHVDLISAMLNDEGTECVGEPVYHYKGIRPPFTREGVTCFKRNGKYYLLTSGMSGYIPNPSEAAVADEVQGPYRILGDPHVDEKGVSSYNSQLSCIFKYPGKDLYVSIADRWVPEFVVDAEVHDKLTRAIASNFNKKYKATLKEKIWMMRSPLMGKANTSISNYVILPLEFEGDMPVIHWRDEWSLDSFSTEPIESK